MANIWEFLAGVCGFLFFATLAYSAWQYLREGTWSLLTFTSIVPVDWVAWTYLTEDWKGLAELFRVVFLHRSITLYSLILWPAFTYLGTRRETKKNQALPEGAN